MPNCYDIENLHPVDEKLQNKSLISKHVEDIWMPPYYYDWFNNVYLFIGIIRFACKQRLMFSTSNAIIHFCIGLKKIELKVPLFYLYSHLLTDQ